MKLGCGDNPVQPYDYRAMSPAGHTVLVAQTATCGYATLFFFAFIFVPFRLLLSMHCPKQTPFDQPWWLVFFFSPRQAAERHHDAI